MNNLDDFLFQCGRPRYINNKLQIDLDLRYQKRDALELRLLGEAQSMLKKKKLLGSTITVGVLNDQVVVGGFRDR